MAVAKKTHKTVSTKVSRQVEMPKRRWYLPRTWRRNLPLPPRRKISSVRALIAATFSLLSKDWRTFTGISVVYALGVLVFVRSFSIASSSTEVVSSASSGISQKIGNTVGQIATLLTDANASLSAASSVYQIIISTVCALALIWAFRQLLSGEKAGVKQSFYQGMTPLIKYLLVLVMIGVQLLPAAAGGYMFGILAGAGVFSGFELTVAGLIFALLAVWSLRLITHSMFALFITTLPDMTPMKSLKSAKKMVYRRRLVIWRKLIGAVVVAALVACILMTPFVLWWPALAPWMVYVLSVLVVPVSQAYLYTLYREIL